MPWNDAEPRSCCDDSDRQTTLLRAVLRLIRALPWSEAQMCGPLQKALHSLQTYRRGAVRVLTDASLVSCAAPFSGLHEMCSQSFTAHLVQGTSLQTEPARLTRLLYSSHQRSCRALSDT